MFQRAARRLSKHLVARFVHKLNDSLCIRSSGRARLASDVHELRSTLPDPCSTQLAHARVNVASHRGISDDLGTSLARRSFTMSTLMIIYDTKYGQTQRIAERIGEIVRRRGHRPEVVRVGAANAIEHADGIVVLAPVFGGKHIPTIGRFVAQRHDALNRRRSAFISVSGSAGSTLSVERDRAQTAASDFVASTPWRPEVIATAGGAIDYPRYNLFLRLLLKFIAKRNGGPTDTSRRHELTDWTAVERIIDTLLTSIEAPLATPSQKAAAFGAELR